MHPPFTRRLMLRAFEAGECLSASGHSQSIPAALLTGPASPLAYERSRFAICVQTGEISVIISEFLCNLPFALSFFLRNKFSDWPEGQKKRSEFR